MRILLASLFCILLQLTACNSNNVDYTSISGLAQGTTFKITYQSKSFHNYSKEIDSLLHIVDYAMSIYDSNSLISRINRNDSNVFLNIHLLKTIRRSLEINKLSDGAFDITVGPLVNAYGFGTAKHSDSDLVNVDSLLQYVGYDKIKIIGNKLFKANPNVIIDVNGIAQGYTTDLIAEFFNKEGIENYLVEVGGEIRTQGVNSKGVAWKVGVDKPIEGNVPGQDLQTIISLSGKSLATSGNYRKFYVKDGVKYTHTIDPKTGKPAHQNLLSVTIIANDCATADAFATACMVRGLEKSREMVRKNKLDAYFIYSDSAGKYCIEINPGLKDKIDQ